jgi:hypothetical protein
MRPRLKFYNVYTRKPFSSSEYDLEKDKNGRPRVVAYDGGNACYRYVSQSFYQKHR